MSKKTLMYLIGFHCLAAAAAILVWFIPVTQTLLMSQLSQIANSALWGAAILMFCGMGIDLIDMDRLFPFMFKFPLYGGIALAPYFVFGWLIELAIPGFWLFVTSAAGFLMMVGLIALFGYIGSTLVQVNQTATRREIVKGTLIGLALGLTLIGPFLIVGLFQK